MRGNDRERGSALITVMLITIALTGIALVVFRQTRTEMTTSGNLRVTEQARQTAQTGLERAALIAMSAPEYFHRLAVQGGAGTAPVYAFGTENGGTGFFRIADPFGGSGTPEEMDRVAGGNLEWRATMSRPRLAEPPPGFQVAGGTGNRFVFYTYQFDVMGWVMRDATTPPFDTVAPGAGGARKALRADVRLGPIAVNQ